MARYVNLDARQTPAPLSRPGAWPTEWSVDVDDRRGDQPEPEAGPQLPAIPRGTRLSPVQEVQQARAAHAAECRQCADVDRQRCAEGDRLWQAWTAALDDAYRRLHGAI